MSWTRSRYDLTYKVALAGFLAIAAFYLLTEHRAHTLGALPYLIILACPLLHLLHHRGHGGHRRGEAGGHHHDGEGGKP